MNRGSPSRIAAAGLVAALFVMGLASTAASQGRDAGNFDARISNAPRATSPVDADQQVAVGDLRHQIPDLAVSFDADTGVTRSVSNRVGFLSGPSPDAPLDIASDFVSSQASLLGLGAGDLVDYEVRTVRTNPTSGTSHVYLRQTAHGLPLYNGQLQVNLSRDGRVLSVNNAFLGNLAGSVNATVPGLTAEQAAAQAADQIGIVADSAADSSASLMLLAIQKGEARLVWNLRLDTPDGQHWYDFNVDAVTGDVWTRFDWVASETSAAVDVLLNGEAPIWHQPGSTVGGAAASGTLDASKRGGDSASASLDTSMTAYVEVDGNIAQFSAVYLNTDGVNPLGAHPFIKVQNNTPNDGIAMFDYAACYTGNHPGTTSFGLGFFALTTPFAKGTLTASQVGSTVTVSINGAVDDSGASVPNQSYVCTGAPPSPGSIQAIGGWNTATLDDLQINGLLVDDFNRADGGLGLSWTDITPGVTIVSNKARGGASFPMSGYTPGAADAKVSGYVETVGTGSQYIAVVLNTDGVNPNGAHPFIKVQNQDGDQLFENAACYTGNNGPGFGLGFFTLTTPFAKGTLTATLAAGDVTVSITGAVDDTGASVPNQSYVCKGAPAAPGSVHGIAGWNPLATIDNFTIAGTLADNFNRADGPLGPDWTNLADTTEINAQAARGVSFSLAVFSPTSTGIPELTVYPVPVESPNHTAPLPPADGRQLVIDPADPIASSLGWHDTGSTAYMIMRGNNVHAYEDSNNSNTPPAVEPSCGPQLHCNFPLNLTQPPSASRPASVANLFYWNNVIHDIQYQYGFDEAGGNFQVNNFGNGGLGNDDVQAQTQDGGGNCNANFGTPSDGSRPRMQMYLCSNSSPAHDGSFDNGVVVHEYGHGISNRSVGGPANVSCLNNTQQMGEGISDILALMYTAEVGDAGPDARGIGTYLVGQPANGPGIRPSPYSTNFGVNSYLYSDIGTAVVPHGVGFVWATAVWEAYWEIVNIHGFDPDFYNAAGGSGNQRMMLYVQEGMANTACGPTFLDARDGIIQAAAANWGGVDVCPLWEAFARRGLGSNATTAGPNSKVATDGFEIPIACQCNPAPIADAGPDQVICKGDVTTVGTPAQAGHSYLWAPGGQTTAEITVAPVVDSTYKVSATNTCGTETDAATVLVTDGSDVGLAEDFEAGAPGWSTSGLWHLANSSVCGSPAPASPTTMYYGQDATCDYETGAANGGRLTSPVIVGVDANSTLTFNYWREVESYSGSYDVTQVEVIDLGTSVRTIVFHRDSATASGSTWLSSGAISLAAFAGAPIQIEFTFDTIDSTANTFTGWFIDDVEVTSSFTCDCSDLDQDGVCDDEDNCLLIPNPNQVDTDLDGFGNYCDPDLNNDGVVATLDFNAFRSAFGAKCGTPNYNPDADFDSDCLIAILDFNILRTYFGGTPGPSGLTCAGTVPCLPFNPIGEWDLQPDWGCSQTPFSVPVSIFQDHTWVSPSTSESGTWATIVDQFKLFINGSNTVYEGTIDPGSAYMAGTMDGGGSSGCWEAFRTGPLTDDAGSSSVDYGGPGLSSP